MLTKSGKAMLQRYTEAEARGALWLDSKGNRWLKLDRGSGQDKATAAKLERDGYGVYIWDTWAKGNGRVFRPTDAGRAAINSN